MVKDKICAVYWIFNPQKATCGLDRTIPAKIWVENLYVLFSEHASDSNFLEFSLLLNTPDVFCS